MNLWRQARRTPVWWSAVALAPALVVADLYGYLDNGTADGQTAFFMLGLFIGLVGGLWIWAWRPQTHMGPLMYWWPALWIAGDLDLAYPTSRTAATIALALYDMGPIVLAQMLLSYPDGRLRGWPARFTIFVLAYAAQVVQNLYNVLFYDGRGCPFCIPAERTWVWVARAPFSVDWWNRGWAIEIIFAVLLLDALVYQKLWRAPPGARRTFAPLVVALTAGSIASIIVLVLVVLGDQAALASISSINWAFDGTSFAAALIAFAGLALTRRARGRVGNLVVELGRAGPGRTGEALARAVGDPSLALALWLPERGVWVNEAGAEVALPETSGRAITFIGDKLAAIIHDPAFLDQPALLEAAGTAARFAIENERLQAELRLQLAELRESRTRIVRAGDEERRRLERDLHDGAQQRLLGIGMALQLFRSKLDGDESAQSLLEETEAEMQAALAELRELARGIHPAVLTDHGLASAVRTLADRAPVPVDVSTCDERLPTDVETAAYFIVAEGLANVAKYAKASRAWVRIERRNSVLAIEVGDNGVGGADLSRGSGLRGLADRAGALDGRLRVQSEPGRGTRLVAELPCGS